MSKPISATVVLVATLTVQSLVAMCLLTLPVVAPTVAQALGISTVYLGLYIAFAYAGAMAASLLSGGVVRRYGAIRASQLGLILCATGVALCAIESPVATALGAVFVGLGYGPITPASSHLLARSTPAHRMSFVFSIKQTGVPLGGVLAGVIVPGLADIAGWQAAFLTIAAVTLLCAVAIQPLCADLDADKDRTQAVSFGNGLAAPLRLVFSQRSLAVLAAVSFMFSITQLSLITYMVTFLHDDLGMGLIVAGFTLAVAQAAGVAGRLLWGYLSDRYLGPIAMLGLLAVLIAICSLATPFLQYFDSQALTLIVLSLFGSSAVGWNGVYLAEVARQAPPGQASIATGGTLSMTFLGIVIGPPIFGLIASAFGSYGLAFASLIVPAGICLWLLWRYRKAFSADAA
ncbi:MFS transporter [Pollutimonas sp. H1-120]|uniref:MFS transporter n=1 Tax=Pollutimonas sp. H1-120 TaxID=3148824 RepID=UPI003B52C607